MVLKFFYINNQLAQQVNLLFSNLFCSAALLLYGIPNLIYFAFQLPRNHLLPPDCLNYIMLQGHFPVFFEILQLYEDGAIALFHAPSIAYV